MFLDQEPSPQEYSRKDSQRDHMEPMVYKLDTIYINIVVIHQAKCTSIQYK